jgi:hypothetical protein
VCPSVKWATNHLCDAAHIGLGFAAWRREGAVHLSTCYKFLFKF